MIQRIGKIGALQRLASVRHDEQPRQTHDMIDAQRAGVAHIRAQELAEALATLRLPSQRIGRRQTPVLSVSRKTIGRGADRKALEKMRRAAPALATVGRRANGEIAAKAEREASIPRVSRRLRELAFAEPLQILMIADAASVFAREACQRERFSIAQRPRPAPPVFAAALLTDRLETGEAKQSVAAVRDEAFEILRCPRARLGLSELLDVP